MPTTTPSLVYHLDEAKETAAGKWGSSVLSRILARGMQLQVAGERIALRSPHDIDVLLRARTGLSSRRVDSLGRLDGAGLSREAEQFSRLQQRVQQLLGSGEAQFLQPADLLDVPDDQDWRDILDGLRALGDDAAPYRVISLQRFSEYLATGQALLRSLRVGAASAGPAERRGHEADDTHAGARQKLLFDLDLLHDGDPTPEEMARLPKGETVAVPMQPHQSLALVLARYRFVLVSGSPFLLVDDSGHDVKLAPGKSVIGRSSEADIALDASYRAVSRRHLMVEASADGLLQLTDISSLGTFVPKEYLGKILH